MSAIRCEITESASCFLKHPLVKIACTSAVTRWGFSQKQRVEYIQQELKDWAELGVEGHFQAANAWMPYHRLLTDQTAALVGANPIEVVVMNSLTVNLHLMMVSFYRPTPARHKIVDRGWGISFRSVRGEVADRFSWLRSR